MKRIWSLILALAMVASLISGCGGGSDAAPTTEAAAMQENDQTVNESTAAPTAEPTEEATTEPTLSPEEHLLASLPERMRQAYELGIADLDQLVDLNREITIGEAAAMLQKAYTAKSGSESKLMADILAMDCVAEPAYLGWVGRLPIALYVEAMEPDGYENYDQWLNYVMEVQIDGLPASDVFLYWKDEQTVYMGGWAWFECGMDYHYENVEGNALLDGCKGHGYLLTMGMQMLYDKTTGNKILDYDGHKELPVAQVLTVGQMAEMALRMYNAFYEPDVLAPYADCTTPNADILTAELLSRETDLPDASCANLPAQWHGVAFEEMRQYSQHGLEIAEFDSEVYEYEIQAVKDAGFNYIGLQIDFSWFQSDFTYGRTDNQDGNLNLTRLEKLDQILAWCMERDIHLDIRATGVGGFTPMKQGANPVNSAAESYADLWSVLAQRYAEVPNTYLSFTVLDHFLAQYGGEGGFSFNDHKGWYQQSDVVKLLKPTVEAIRTVTPDRCIIADISGQVAGEEKIVELGIALAAELTDMNAFFGVARDPVLNHDTILNTQWPYNETCDANAMLNRDTSFREKSSVLAIAQLAKDNGLGFMVNGWGDMTWGKPEFASVRYPDETYEAFIEDVTSALAEQGFGWCYQSWYGLGGIVYSQPMLKNAAYQQIGEYPLYFDTAILGLFQKANSVTE